MKQASLPSVERGRIDYRLTLNDASVASKICEDECPDLVQPIDGPRIRQPLDPDPACQTRHEVELARQPLRAYLPAVERSFHELDERLSRRKRLDAHAGRPACVAGRRQRRNRLE